jgi:hypothetical protein
MMMNVTRQRYEILKPFICFLMNSRPNCENCQFFVKNSRDRTSLGFCRKLNSKILFPNSPRCSGLLYKNENDLEK